MVAEQGLDLFALVHAKQAVVDEDAGQLLANGLVDQDRRNRTVDAARQPANDSARPDLFADFGDLGGAKLGHRPVASQPANLVHEVGNQLCAVGCVDDLGVEHRGVISPRFVDADRERRVGRGTDISKPSGATVTRSPWLIHTG